MSAKISIIIPIYKVEQYLPRCLDSVLNQTFTDWQAILVDDGGPDNSGKIADEYAKHDSRFVVLHKQNAGVSVARNYGLDHATGEYIMFLDSDDCIHPQTMEICYKLAKKTNTDIVTFYYNRKQKILEQETNFQPNQVPEFFNDLYDTDKIKYKKTNNLIKMATNHDKGPNSWFCIQCFVTMRFYRREFIAGLEFQTKIHVLEDFVYWSMVLLREPTAVLTKLQLYSYTVNNTSLLHTNHGIRSILGIIDGIRMCALSYMQSHNKRTANLWYKRFMWSVLSRVYRSVKKMPKTSNDFITVIEKLNMLHQDGILDLAPNMHARRYRRRMLDLLNKANKI